MPFGGWSKPCNNECKNDNDCQGDKKCCRLSSCATYCAEPIYIDENGAIPKPTPTESKIVFQSDAIQSTSPTDLSINSRIGQRFVDVSAVSKPEIQHKEVFQSERVPTTNCHDECNSDLDCHTSFSCTKIGCRHVCFLGDNILKQMHKVRHETSLAISGIADSFVENIKIDNTSKACRRQCSSQADCSNGFACVRINCHFLCVQRSRTPGTYTR